MSTLAFKYFDDALAQYTKTPVHGSVEAAGVDLFPLPLASPLGAAIRRSIDPGQTMLIRTNLCVRIPSGYYGRIAPRSSISMRGLIVNAGVIDSDYRGELKICMLNASDTVVVLDEDKAIAQLIIEHCIIVGEVRMVATLDETERGDKGFGSTDRVYYMNEPGGKKIPESKRQKLEARMSVCDSCIQREILRQGGKCRTPTECTCPTPQPVPELSLD